MNASFFDIDGTLKQGFLMVEFSEYLVSRDLFSKEKYAEMANWVNLYTNNKTSYRRIAIELPKIYCKSIKGLKVSCIENESKRFVSGEIRKKFYDYAEGLTKLMKGYGLTIGISGAQSEVVRDVGDILKFDLTVGSEADTKRGVFTGNVKQNMVIKEVKEAALKKIVKDKKIELNKSFGFGDTEQDLSFLLKVGNPVALNPNKELLIIAKRNNWMIFNSGDDVIGELKKRIR